MNKLFFLLFALTIATISCNTGNAGKKESSAKYIRNAGYIFGTSYHIKYQSNDDYGKELVSVLNRYSKSLNAFDSNSVISRINNNDTTVVLDSYFIKCFEKAKEVSEITDGAFDITVAPVVNAWGFGFNDSMKVDNELIDSLMQFIGYSGVEIVGNKFKKKHKETMLDAGAIAKGYGVDIASDFLESKGVENFMVEIGGEVRVKGVNPKGVNWRIGIDKPIDDVMVTNRELQDIVDITDKSLATSGNYRQFYEKDGVKYSHTINPKTGYPARNSLLSASVLTDDCMTADAFATAFMVLGTKKSIELANRLDYIDIYLIYTDSSNNYKIYKSEKFEKIIEKQGS
jgi:thiamine biosynthesis lipoprotein